jgi:hypothetical protein
MAQPRVRATAVATGSPRFELIPELPIPFRVFPLNGRAPEQTQFFVAIHHLGSFLQETEQIHFSKDFSRCSRLKKCRSEFAPFWGRMKRVSFFRALAEAW